MTLVQYTRFSGFYFFYFASLGIFLPFWPLYLQSLGYNALEIGQLIAVVLSAGIFAPNLWAWLADHTGHRILLIRVAALGSTLGMLGLQWVTGFHGMLLLLLVFSFFWYATLPLVEGITLNHLEQNTDSRYAYTHVRLWGSLGFVLVCLSISLLASGGDSWEMVPQAMLACHFCGFLVTLLISSRDHKSTAPHLTLLRLLQQPAILGLLVAFVLMQVSHGPFYTFFSIYLEDHGYALETVAALWSAGVFAEVLVFLAFSRYLQHHPAWILFAVAFGLASVRWVLLGSFPMHWIVVLGSQLLHAASYGMYHSVSVKIMHRLFPGHMQSRGQALYSSLSYGAGAALGALLAGIAWDDLGASLTFYAAAGVATVGMVLGWYSVRHARLLEA